ncbi:MAG: multiple sugar transport system substrate-binding protein [Thermomicrobiales bacterium]|nr:multiple sugar transport system substrate-binding protein [Thermomicrobiales bacterium]
MAERELTFREKQERRDGAIVDFSRGLINRREFLRRVTAVGVSVAFAGRMAEALAAPKPAEKPSRWAKQAEATVTMIKGPHHPDDAKFWDEMKTQFESSHPGIKLNPTFFDWAQMDAQLTAGYASDAPPDVVYLVDLVLAKFVNAGQVADITAWTDDPAYATEKAAIAPFTWDVTKISGVQRGVGVLGAAFGIFYNVDLLEKAGITEFPKTRDALVEAAKALTKDGVYGFQFRDRFPDYAHWDWMPYVHNDDGDVLTPDLTAQNLDPKAVAATQWLTDAKLVHKISPEAGAYDWNTQRALFEAGRIAILHDEYPQAAVWEIAKPVGFKLDVAQAPATTEGGKQTTMGNFGYAAISEKSPVKEAAWEFVKWWASADVINPYAAKIGLQGVRTDSAPPYESTLLQKVQTDFVPKVQGVQLHENYYQMLTNLWPEIEKAYRGEQSGEDAAAKAGAAVTALLGES